MLLFSQIRIKRPFWRRILNFLMAATFWQFFLELSYEMRTLALERVQNMWKKGGGRGGLLK